jgi:hypothetical protein
MDPILVFRHRVHEESELRSIQYSSLIQGIECDIRYRSGLPYLNHDIDKSTSGIALEVALKYLKGKHVILNIKETGAELDLVNLSLAYGAIPLILDAPFPAIRHMYHSGFGSTIMWRISEYETLTDNVINEMPPTWIWLDSFERYWFDTPEKLPTYLKTCNVCLVSSELQGRDSFVELDIATTLIGSGLINAICTKYPSRYKRPLGEQPVNPNPA